MAQYLIDTNVLLRAAAPGSAHHAAAVRTLTALLAQGEELLLAPQVLVEFWSVATRPRDVNGYGWTVAETESEITKLLEQFPLLPETAEVFTEWLHLVVAHGTIGKQVHDARIVALLNIHGIHHLLTFNGGDFAGYGINVVVPDATV